MNIAIIGLGLIGGSIGLALKNTSAGIAVIGIPRREVTIQEAIGRKAIDWGTTDTEKGIKDADIVFICTPINLIIPKLKEFAPMLKKGAIVTDVGSSKAGIVSQAEKLMPKGTYFVGGHPMAGKEKVKIQAAELDLLKDKTYVLTETARTSKKALEKMEEVVKMIGSKVVKMDPKLHDLVAAGISHMPLAVAVALVNTIADSEKGKDEMKACAVSGFRDTTRIASGDPILGVDMFTTNKKAVLKQLSAFKKSLSKMEKLIRESDVSKLETELKRAKEFRDPIYG
ncbi:MAG: prephenate dehydrogenase/arogenate dehydrogenase family protein [Candidatus Margulisiibacteriota bacterium]|nr:prephenate dehydrogenase/arogenate dehydrogenase family protein [Candidatus Margulisiibacteriota bacterium]